MQEEIKERKEKMEEDIVDYDKKYDALVSIDVMRIKYIKLMDEKLEGFFEDGVTDVNKLFIAGKLVRLLLELADFSTGVIDSEGDTEYVAEFR